MSGVVVKKWKRGSQDRLYVNDEETGQKVAEYDRNTGKIIVLDNARESEVLQALRHS